MTFKGFGKAPEPTEPSITDEQLKTIIDRAMKGDETAMFFFKKIQTMKHMDKQFRKSKRNFEFVFSTRRFNNDSRRRLCSNELLFMWGKNGNNSRHP